jgi:hypothetical protein
MNVVRTDEEIERVEKWAFEGLNSGSHYYGMSYEEGILALLDWLRGVGDCAPDDLGDLE